MYSSEEMCTSSEIKGTTNIIITARPSIWMPAVSRTPPFWNHVTWCSTGRTAASPPEPPSAPRCPMLRPSAPSAVPPLASWTRMIQRTSAPQASTNDEPTARTPTSDPWRGIFLPNSRITTNDTAGISGISHAWSRKNIEALPLALHRVDVVEVGAVEVSVDQQHDRKPDTDFRGGDGE